MKINQLKHTCKCSIVLHFTNNIRKFLEVLREHVPNMKPSAILSDYEDAIIKACKTVFPLSCHYDDFFHFMQANVRWFQRNGGKDLISILSPL